MKLPKHPALRIVALLFVFAAILACTASMARNFVIGNPIGVAINLLTLIFLVGGFVTIWLDRAKPSI